MKRSELYQSIKAQAKAAMPNLQYIDLQKQQTKRAKDDYPMPLPALFIEFRNASFSALAGTRQQAKMIVSFTLVQECVTDSFDDAELETETIELLDANDAVYEAFHCFNIGGYGKLIRIAESKPEYGIRSIEFTTDFELSVFENKVDTRVNIPSPKISIQVHA